jgi:phospholipid transport system substrate-binding protein|tara:strand:- start:611 stop:1186 length:576 start_codon:yes stop_codon:yes gene_type:complete
MLVVSTVYMSSLQGQSMSALETAKLGVNTLLETAIDSKSLFLTDREQYFEEIESVLESFVDFNAVARVVMSRFDDQATEDQRTRFADILKSSLTRFYGASLVSYQGEELIFLPQEEKESNPRDDVVVSMELTGGSMELQLQYQMFINDSDDWKLKNLSLAGINLGRQYFAQFSALMTEHGNNIDSVLNNWK